MRGRGGAWSEPRYKRPFDVLVSGLALTVLSPLLGLIAAAIRVDSPGPILFRATRSGRGGLPFTMYKFRTMRARPDQHGPKITTHADSRVTRVGKILRPARLDELPNLWNVLRGEMSLVGPRPEDPHYVELYADEDRSVLSARPGVTSLASLLYRDEERLLVGEGWEKVYVEQVMPAKLAIDRAYVERQSLMLDLKILAATALSPLRLEWLFDLEGEIAALTTGSGAAPASTPTLASTRAADGRADRRSDRFHGVTSVNGAHSGHEAAPA